MQKDARSKCAMFYALTLCGLPHYYYLPHNPKQLKSLLIKIPQQPDFCNFPLSDNRSC